jgi:hypothetical protein
MDWPHQRVEVPRFEPKGKTWWDARITEVNGPHAVAGDFLQSLRTIEDVAAAVIALW